MYAEVDAHEAKLPKAHQIKQGMMQERSPAGLFRDELAIASSAIGPITTATNR